MEVADLSCGLCGNLYNSDTRCPRNLPCGHTYCHFCLCELFTHRVIRCPEDHIALITRKAADLPINYIVQKLALKAGISTSLCPTHNKPLEYCCLDDQVAICSACGLAGRHKGHRIETEEGVKRQFDQRVQGLCDLMSVLQAAQVGRNSHVEGLQDLFEDYLRKKADLENKVKTQFQTLRKELAEAERKAMQGLNKDCEQVEAAFVQARELPADLAAQLLAIQSSLSELTAKLDCSLEPVVALELVSGETDRLIPIGELTLSELEAQDQLPEALKDMIISLDVDLNYHLQRPKIECEPEINLLKPESKPSISSLSDAFLPAPPPLIESDFLAKVSELQSSTSVDFSKVGAIGDRAVQLAPFLLASDTLKSLHFSSNQLSAKSVCALCKALEGNSSLWVLELKNNSLGTEACEHLLRALALNKTLRQVSLKGCWLGKSYRERLEGAGVQL